jgi:hypothetical protein
MLRRRSERIVAPMTARTHQRQGPRATGWRARGAAEHRAPDHPRRRPGHDRVLRAPLRSRHDHGRAGRLRQAGVRPSGAREPGGITLAAGRPQPPEASGRRSRPRPDPPASAWAGRPPPAGTAPARPVHPPVATTGARLRLPGRAISRRARLVQGPIAMSVAPRSMSRWRRSSAAPAGAGRHGRPSGQYRSSPVTGSATYSPATCFRSSAGRQCDPLGAVIRSHVEAGRYRRRLRRTDHAHARPRRSATRRNGAGSGRL